MTEFWILVLWGLGANVLIMSLCWAWAARIDNFGIVDAVWSLSFGVQALLYVSLSETWIFRKYLLLSIVGFWSLRLGLFLAHRIYQKHPKEDSRYTEIRESYGLKFLSRFFLFFQFQGLSVSLLAIPFVFIALNSTPEFSIWEIAGLAVWILGVAGESIADHQKSQFRRAHPQRNCEVGLWKYSRHPNYFFESVIWWGFYLVALGSPQGAYSVFAPLIILFLLTKVTGVPLSEKHSLRSCPDEYLDYQKRVSIFVPWFPEKKAPSNRQGL